MYRISLVAGKRVLTSSLYPTKEAAKAAATQLRLISVRWNKAIRSVECERPGAKPLTYKFHAYTVTSPTQTD